MKERKIVQIAVCHDGAKDENPFIYALCDDGTVWELFHHDRSWNALPEIPQGPAHGGVER